MASGASQSQYSPSQYTTTPAHGFKVRRASLFETLGMATVADFSSLPQRSHADMEVSHRSSISLSPLFEPLDDPHHLESPPPNRSHLVLPPLVPNIRSPAQNMPPPGQRRGFDFRRPVISNEAQPRGGEVVDLTNSDEEDDDEAEDEELVNGEHDAVQEAGSQRLPHYNHPIIDLSTDSSPADVRTRRTPEHSRRTPYLEGRRPPSLLREGSSDVTFMQMRRRQDDDRRAREEQHQRRETGTPSPARRPNPLRPQDPDPIDLTGDDELIFVRAERRPGARPSPPHRSTSDRDPVRIGRNIPSARHRGRHPRLEDIDALLHGVNVPRQDVPHLYEQVGRLVQNTMQGVAGYLPWAPRNGGGTARGFVPPQMMDYAHPAFGMGLDGVPGGRGSPAPPYRAPEKPEVGFTRSPQEDEVVCCPNCGDELAVGGSEEKRSVWVVKGCGHVYCGQCMLHRHASKRNSKGKQKDDGTKVEVQPFKQCVVDGCTQKVQKAQVLQLFL
ncbi:Hypothetical protein D9617_14g076710 [Elsinoe fawcettii]|nr:Hypothetical protein D9617_14g076710 [Elsinoe fawcettii]